MDPRARLMAIQKSLQPAHTPEDRLNAVHRAIADVVQLLLENAQDAEPAPEKPYGE